MNFEVIENQHIRMEICPAVGCKVISFISKKDNYNWFWENPEIELRKPLPGDQYVKDLDTGGWDEIIPSISPCELHLDGQVIDIPDHGDAVYLSAEILNQTETSLAASIAMQSYPIELTRSIKLIGRSVEISYHLINKTSERFPFIWAMHPIFKIEPGMRIHMGDQSIYEETDSIGQNRSIDYSDSLWEIPDFRDEEFDVFASKLFSKSHSCSQVALEHEDHGRLNISWDSDEIPHAAIWLNVGAWSGSAAKPYFNLGIEPTNCPYDSLTDSINEGQGVFIEPNQVKTWKVKMELNL